MRTYSVFEPPVLPGSTEEDAESLVFVRHGWSLAALFFPALWMAFRRLWWVLLAYIVGVGILAVLDTVVSPLWVVALSVAFAIVIMLEAGQLRLETMAVKGYREIAILDAANQREAEKAFFTAWLADRHAKDEANAARTTVHRPSSATPPALPGMS